MRVAAYTVLRLPHEVVIPLVQGSFSAVAYTGKVGNGANVSERTDDQHK